jgi:hypothetical protein
VVGVASPTPEVAEPPLPEIVDETQAVLAPPTPTPTPIIQVETLAGGDLFEFGDVDGKGNAVRLQHPLGVVYADGALYIADTYNHKIKRLDPQTGIVKTLAGTGKPGQTDGANPSFYEPGGLSFANGKLYVADTNNHAVRVVDLASGQTTTLPLRGLRPPAASVKRLEANAADSPAPNAEEINVAPQSLLLARDAAAGNTLMVEVSLPAGYHLNELAPHRLQATIERGAERIAFEGNARRLTREAKDLLRLPLRLPLRPLADGAAQLRLQLTLYYCREDNTGACRIKTLIWLAPLQITSDTTAPREIKLRGEVK